MAFVSILANLPLELFLQVIADETLSNRDLKALRLTCSGWAHHAEPHLFRRIVISRLREDKIKFEQISNTPHLARHVQQLVWHELCLEVWTPPATEEDDDFEYMNSLLTRAANDSQLFWFPRKRQPRVRRAYIIKYFRGRFVDALNRMPKLRTFISCSMPPERTFYYEDYPLHAGLYSINQNIDLPGGNDGFFEIMLPLIADQQRIEALHLADERTDRSSLRRGMEPFAFNALTSIDLCISHFEEDDLDGLIICLLEAAELKNLSLCFERTSSSTGKQVVDKILLFHSWPHLTSLQLGGTRFSRELLGRFCRRHSEQLRHLALVMCRVSVRDLMQLTGLQLDSITIRSNNDEFSHFIPQGRILPFINGESYSIIATERYRLLEQHMCEIRTEVSIYDHHNCSTAAYFDSKLGLFSEAYPITDLMEINSGSEEVDMEFGDSQEKTYWAWGKLGQATYYWRVDRPELANTETTFWKFTKENGLVEAYGEDPLEYFADWDADAGDVATPMPYCAKLHEFSWSRRVGRLVPLEGACRYDRYENPWLDVFGPSETRNTTTSYLRNRSYQRPQY
ncbi:hypothetical protein GGR53DRAFT_528597 [Hypoxylon sp. FL1150]|nr:hypothetical protein GGR53DRAFT_528597 [Hypoxylon sp. FL1150]